jgi:hypothetical protein
MALEYALYIETDLNPEHVLGQIFAGIGMKAKMERSDKAGGGLSTSGPGFITSAYQTGDFRR